ncbi:unnamed protein product [Clonostachys chloroleuca]|uniref:FAD-binding domain-containing protein n=1 Tax=Clonostachys chloroleuca TaxID=1926264 RepID=A0AA35M2Y0_9HYPO|nr:unnamed protein product [Clonostachys chloroleuca]
MQDQPFRVIVIGAGPAGLYLARALGAAKIGYVVLERAPSTFLERGNHLLLFPHTIRLLHQIGLYDEAKKRSYKLRRKIDMTKTGYVLSDYTMWHLLEERHGYPTLPIQRYDVLEMCYKSIPNREHLIKTEAKAVSIKETDQGVEVELEDGTVETGSVVIGADGVHGMTKKYIEEAVFKTTTEATGAPLFNIPTTSQYYSIYAEGTKTKKIPSGIFYETRDTGRAIQLGADNDTLRIVMYRKLPQQMTGPVSYTAEQMEEFAEALFDMAVTPWVTLGEIWPDFHKHTARLVNQNEGFAKHWHTGRVVITSDASVCTSSVNGLGVNCGLHSSVALANQLQQAVFSSAGNPSTESLREAFARYQRIHARELQAIYIQAHSSMRQLTWDSWKNWFIDRFLRRWIGSDFLVRKYLNPLICRGQILSYVPFKGVSAPLPWRRTPDVPINEDKESEPLVVVE